MHPYLRVNKFVEFSKMSSSLRSSATPFTMPIQAFIPFIDPDYTADQVVRKFDELDLGRVTYIDLHTKESTRSASKTSSYSYAFIKVDPYDTTSGRNLRNKLQNRLVVRIIHDGNPANYWDIKPFLTTEQRMAGDYVISPSSTYTAAHSSKMHNEPYDEVVDVSVCEQEEEEDDDDAEEMICDDDDDVDTTAATHSPRWATTDLEDGEIVDEDDGILNHLCEGLMITPLDQIQIAAPTTQPSVGSSVSFFETIWTNPTPMASISNPAFRAELQREYEQLQREIDALRNAPEYNLWGGISLHTPILHR